jgi:hypothetical protein
MAYTASYFWFRQSHSEPPSFHSSVPITTVSTGFWDSALLALFYPALCFDASFGPSRVFIRSDSSSEALLYYKRYPFAEFVPQSNTPTTATQ